MKITEKINLDYNGLIENGPINIVAFGDSVTHGAFESGVIDYEAVYWNQFRKKILEVRNYVPVNVINAGIGGIDALTSVKRIDTHVLNHNPDLVIVCFGLNDVNGPMERYLDSLRIIFDRCSAVTDVVFMTPNMLNTYVADDSPPEHKEYAAKTADMQNSGRMDLYMSEAVKLAEGMGITVCDCYSEWKKLAETKDTTKLLANRINHPTREMHKLFADMLFKTVFGKEHNARAADSTMYKG